MTLDNLNAALHRFGVSLRLRIRTLDGRRVHVATLLRGGRSVARAESRTMTGAIGRALQMFELRPPKRRRPR